jgi:hypothetical protein
VSNDKVRLLFFMILLVLAAQMFLSALGINLSGLRA